MAGTEKPAGLPLKPLQSAVKDPEIRHSAKGPDRGELESALLFQGRRELVIHHAGQDYRLKITRQDKLILTK
jgi:hemin uptake protein HemP